MGRAQHSAGEPLPRTGVSQGHQDRITSEKHITVTDTPRVMDSFINLILTFNTLFMTQNINNSVCPRSAGFCFKTSFALGLGS